MFGEVSLDPGFSNIIKFHICIDLERSCSAWAVLRSPRFALKLDSLRTSVNQAEAMFCKNFAKAIDPSARARV